jgi:hypothetical protein
MCNVVNKRTHVKTNKDIYIGRPSKYGNPFEIGKDGTREEVVSKYRIWLYNKIGSSEITIDELVDMKDKNLVCWCAPLRCHGDVLKAAIKWACE